jgi:hypothetical protein
MSKLCVAGANEDLLKAGLPRVVLASKQGNVAVETPKRFGGNVRSISMILVGLVLAAISLPAIAHDGEWSDVPKPNFGAGSGCHIIWAGGDSLYYFVGNENTYCDVFNMRTCVWSYPSLFATDTGSASAWTGGYYLYTLG